LIDLGLQSQEESTETSDGGKLQQSLDTILRPAEASSETSVTCDFDALGANLASYRMNDPNHVSFRNVLLASSTNHLDGSCGLRVHEAVVAGIEAVAALGAGGPMADDRRRQLLETVSSILKAPPSMRLPTSPSGRSFRSQPQSPASVDLQQHVVQPASPERVPHISQSVVQGSEQHAEQPLSPPRSELASQPALSLHMLSDILRRTAQSTSPSNASLQLPKPPSRLPRQPDISRSLATVLSPPITVAVPPSSPPACTEAQGMERIVSPDGASEESTARGHNNSLEDVFEASKVAYDYGQCDKSADLAAIPSRVEDPCSPPDSRDEACEVNSAVLAGASVDGVTKADSVASAVEDVEDEQNGSECVVAVMVGIESRGTVDITPAGETNSSSMKATHSSISDVPVEARLSKHYVENCGSSEAAVAFSPPIRANASVEDSSAAAAAQAAIAA